MIPSKIITLTTDFGFKDPYVAEMKAVILQICPKATMVDITHEISKFSVSEASFILSCAAPFFSQGTVHVSVVDPGVGSKRRPIIVETKKGFFVGPDNGLLVLASKALHMQRVRVIENRGYMLEDVSGTFHGRDIFAPVAAYISNGVSTEEFGPVITDFVQPSFTQIKHTDDGILGEVLHIDDFGNIISNIQSEDFVNLKEELLKVTVNAHVLQPIRLSRAYADSKLQETTMLFGSHGFLEIALNKGDAAAKFGIRVGDEISIFRIKTM